MGRTVAELREQMSNAEYVQWRTFFARRGQREELEMKRAKASKGR